jgi:hypothetical protein
MRAYAQGVDNAMQISAANSAVDDTEAARDQIKLG